LTLNESIPGMTLNFTNSSIDMVTANGYFYETEIGLDDDPC